jgi:hypothetical protein
MMTTSFEVNGSTYTCSGGEGVRDVEQRLRMTFGGHEVQLDVQIGGASSSLHILGNSISTYAVWEMPEHSGSQG